MTLPRLLTPIAAASTLAITLLAAPLALAQQGEASPRLSVTQIEQRLSTDGYRMLEFERDDGIYEVKALNSEGQCLELKLHPGTAEILHSERDDDCWDDRSQRNASRQ